MLRELLDELISFFFAHLRELFKLLSELFAEGIHVEIASVSSTAAEGKAVGLVQLAVVVSVVALEEAVLYCFYRQIKSPRFAVYVDLRKAAQRRGDAHLVHERVGEIVLHEGLILNEVVQAELIQSVIRSAGLILVKLDLEAVAVISVGCDGRKRGVSLGTQSDV